MKYKQLRKDRDKYKRMYMVSNEMEKHYESLYNTSFQEFYFQWIQKQLLDDLVTDVFKLLDKWIKSNLVQKYIENWRDKVVLEQSMHFDEVVWIEWLKEKFINNI